MATTQITFTPQQIEYLTGWFTEQGGKYVTAVMEDDFEADQESFERLIGSTFDATGLPRGNTDVREVNDKPSKTTKRVKKEKKAKDPDAPKRAKTPYMNWLWGEDGMPRVKSENEGIAHKDAMSKAAKEWKAMDETAKDKWVKMSAAQKQEYDTAMETYNK
tara:strand:+ start:2111 stop:2593 length:483 start_codon:yes stop_codon:yes gene_type:complete